MFGLFKCSIFKLFKGKEGEALCCTARQRVGAVRWSVERQY